MSALIVFMFLFCFSGKVLADQEKINNVRGKVMKFCESNKDSVYPYDCEQHKTKDYLISRYLKNNDFDTKGAAEAIIDTLKWYKTEKLGEINDTYFPSELYGSGVVINQGTSKDGRLYIGVRMSCLYPPLQINEQMHTLFRKYIQYLFYKIRMEVNEPGLLLYAQIKDSKIKNYDKKTIKSLMTFLNDYSPEVPIDILMIDVSPLLKFASNILMSLLDKHLRKKVKFIKLAELKNWIDPDGLPVNIGGNKKPYNRIPAGVGSGYCLSYSRDMRRDVWQKYRKQNKACIERGMKESQTESVDKFLNSC